MTHYKKKRFHVVLDGEDTKKLEKLARTESLSVSWLIRRAIRQWLDSFNLSSSLLREKGDLSKREDPFLSVIGLFKMGSVSSRQIDRELYGH